MDIWIINKGKGQIWDKRKQKRKMLQFTDLYQWMFSPGEDGVRPALGRRTLGCLWKRSSIWLVSVHSHLKIQLHPGLCWRGAASREREGILSLCSALLQWDPTWSDSSSSEAPNTRSWPVGMSLDNATKMIKDRLRDLGVFILEKRKPQRDVAWASIQ